jgi:AraC family transcriptional regulator
MVPNSPDKQPRQRVLAESADWTVRDVICVAGPHDRPFEEQHHRVSVALVMAGTFQYRTDTGSSMLYPGAFLLGNSGACFECGHEHATGDRCVALGIARSAFEEIAAGVTGSSRFRFRNPMVPARSGLITRALALQRVGAPWGQLETEGAVFGLVEAIVESLTAQGPTAGRTRARDVRQLTGVLRYIDSSPAHSPSLEELAAIAAMSKYHFLRTFRRITGVTPHQYVLQRRLHRAALVLVTTRDPVAKIAMTEGFGDLSTFNRQFRRGVGTTPTQLRSTASWHELGLLSRFSRSSRCVDGRR